MGETDFGQFVGSMPRDIQARIAGDETVSTAYWKARRAGWTSSQLVMEGMRLMARGGSVGLVIHRLRALADNPPMKPEPTEGTGPRFACYRCGARTTIKTGNGNEKNERWACLPHLYGGEQDTGDLVEMPVDFRAALAGVGRKP